MAIPGAVLAGGWIPFVVVLVLTLLFSVAYIRYFQSKYDSELLSTVVSMLALAVALLTSALVPVDIFLVSYMKTPDGHFQPWANQTADRRDLENVVLYAYYALYACILLFLCVLLPFAYFYYEEGDEDTTTRSRLCSAFKFTLVFMFVAGVLLLIGAFAPLKHAPNTNGTEWDRMKFLLEELGSNGGEDALSFAISSITLLGMFFTVVYTGYGMSAWPMDLVKGRRSAYKERTEVINEREETNARIQAIKNKYKSGRRISSRDRQRIDDLEETERLLLRRERHLQATEQSWLAKCGMLLRPLQIVGGLVCFILGLLVFISLLLTNIDKIMHSLGWRMGYALPKRHLPNLIDMTLVYAQQVFPMDYILFDGLILYFFLCTMGGLQHIGIWCCWIRMYKMRPRHTRPQGLLFMCFLLMMIVLALNIVVYQITPQYSMFGSQHYVKYSNTTEGNHTVSELMPCSTDAPPDQCTMTRMTMLLTTFFYKVWFFGACYFWASWALLAIILIGFVVALVRKRRSSVEGQVDADDFDDSDDEMLRA